MDEQVSRRRFLAAGTLGGAGVVSAGALSSFLATGTEAAAGSPDVGVNAPDPYFLEGKVVSVAGSSLVVLAEGLLMRRVQATNGTEIWKGRVTTFEDVQVGDAVFARGLP